MLSLFIKHHSTFCKQKLLQITDTLKSPAQPSEGQVKLAVLQTKEITCKANCFLGLINSTVATLLQLPLINIHDTYYAFEVFSAGLNMYVFFMCHFGMRESCFGCRANSLELWGFSCVKSHAQNQYLCAFLLWDLFFRRHR